MLEALGCGNQCIFEFAEDDIITIWPVLATRISA